jgi:hypothetical protein
VNYCEARIAESLRADGWKVLRNGWPDFLCWRDESDGRRKVICVEVKDETTGDSLRKPQIMNHAVLTEIGLPVYVLGKPEDRPGSAALISRQVVAEALLRKFEELVALGKADLVVKNSGRGRSISEALRACWQDPEYRRKVAERRWPNGRKTKRTSGRVAKL